MKEISRKQINEAVEREYTEGLNRERLHLGNYFDMMIDTDDASIWSAVYDNSSWGVHHSSTIHHLEKEGKCDECAMAYCADQAVKLLKAAGWIITE